MIMELKVWNDVQNFLALVVVSGLASPVVNCGTAGVPMGFST